MDPFCRVIGVLDSGVTSLSPAAGQWLREARVVIAPRRLLDLCGTLIHPDARQLPLDGRTGRVPEWIREAWERGEEVVALASGDPLFHGLASFLLKRLPGGSVVVEPNLSYLQIALTRLGVPGEGAARVSVHKGDGGDWRSGAGRDHPMYPLVRALPGREWIALLTSPANGPARIARLLLEEGWEGHYRVIVCEHLCRGSERISGALTPAEVLEGEWADPNVVVVHRVDPWPGHVLLGLPEAAYQDGDGRGLVTRREVRGAALGQMALTGREIVWDVGAGSGSVALEAARLCPDGWVYAVEKSGAAVERIQANRRRLELLNVTVLHAKAPEGLAGWPDPDVVFVGGSCGNLDLLIRLALERLREGGRLVLNFVTLENLAVAMTVLNASHARWEVVQIHAARGAGIKGMNRLEGAAPVWVVTAWPTR